MKTPSSQIRGHILHLGVINTRKPVAMRTIANLSHPSDFGKTVVVVEIDELPHANKHSDILLLLIHLVLRHSAFPYTACDNAATSIRALPRGKLSNDANMVAHGYRGATFDNKTRFMAVSCEEKSIQRHPF